MNNEPTEKTSPEPVDSIEQFEALFNHATIGIVVSNRRGEIINFNRFAESQFGYSKDELLGRPVEVLLPKDIHKKHAAYRKQYYAHPAQRAMGHGRDLYAQKKDGATFPVEVSLSHYLIHGQTFVIAFVIDITMRKTHESLMLHQTEELERVTTEIRKLNTELEQKIDDRTKMLREALVELEKSKEELSEAYENEKELSELKSRFVTMASHEFRTPLSTILSSAYLLEQYNKNIADARVTKHVHRIKSAVDGMKNILEDFLSLGKLEEGLQETKMEWLQAEDFEQLVHNLVQEFETTVIPPPVFVIENSVTGFVWLDSYLLKNILTNLLSNAIKFSKAGGVIQIRSALREQKLVVSVEDQGIGISEEDQQHLFERFFRAKNAANIQGTGLGLHIVSKYLDLVQGSIEMKSTLDAGSTFTISIPQPKFEA